MPTIEPGNLTLLWIPLFPLLGAVFNLLFGRLCMRSLGERLGKEMVHLVAIGAVAFSCFFTFSLVFQLMLPVEWGGQGRASLTQEVYTWMVSGETRVGFDLVIDRLSAVMCMVVTGVGLLIHIFSVGYMAKDPDYHRYFAYLNLFMASMLILVMGDNLVVLFVGWEGVGLCSYLLIGFWFTDDAKATAGRKAFIVNRIGDFGFLLGMLLIYSVVGSLDFDAIRQACAAGPDSMFVTTSIFGVTLATLATILLFVGCTGKSAQVPLYVWLPDAMAGPTPVSALIHAATMVTAGVYLIVRLNPLFALAPLTLGIIAVIGAVTALLAATIGITQNDIKKVLAYSTVSQLGFMFLAVGMGAWTSAVFHLVTHAFFKACLFLGSGAVIEACHHDQDIRTMGGLRKKMPVTAMTFFVSCLAIAGIPFFSGFFSKDEILLYAYTNASIWSPGINYFGYVMGLCAAACTAFYMFRLYYLTFEGKFRGDHHTWTHHVREYAIMSAPLIVLAALAAVGGFLGYPHALPGHHILPHVVFEWLEPIRAISENFTGDYFIGPRARADGAPEWFVDASGHITASAEIGFMAVSVFVAASGILFARKLYRNGPSKEAEAWANRLGPLYRASVNKYWVDEIYRALFVRPVRFIGGFCYQVFDQLVIDGLGVGGVSGTVGVTGNLARIWHNGNVRRYLVVLVLGVGVLFAAIYANPAISQVGPNPVHPVDMGGLRPTMGEQPFRIEFLGQPIYESKRARDLRSPPKQGERVRLPTAQELLERDEANRGEQ
jgi:NADH-quinone oxidoreductase subunit L